MSGSPASTSYTTNQKSGAAWTGLFHLLVIYIVWGSTYLAIRIAVREGAGFPPFSMGAMRLLAAGCLLLIGVALFRMPMRLTKQDFTVLLLSGMLLWVGGNGLIMWAEQRADSGYAALLVATTPIWVALIEALLDRRMPPFILVASLLTGFGGICLLSAPMLQNGTRADALSALALLIAPICWSAGTLLMQRRPLTLNPFVSSGYQQFFGGLGLALISVILGEPRPTPSAGAWWAWGYLVVVASLFAYTSFIMAVRLLPAGIVATYAYVNPVVAVFLGWLVLNERIGAWTFAGMALVLLGVAGVFRSKKSKDH